MTAFQVCSHIVAAIRKETSRVRDEWEQNLANSAGSSGNKSSLKGSSDAYCFELLSMVLALSGSEVGSGYLAQQHNLLQDLLSLLHTASPRVQRQVRKSKVCSNVIQAILALPRLPRWAGQSWRNGQDT